MEPQLLIVSIAVLQFKDDDYFLDYDTPITDDNLREALIQIRSL